ncbi:MAG TPA: phosphatase PAP2 family protein [Bacteroidales bacterium]|nr:phosphatase PAP2 family protein [Bacteroidales bacterium]
MLVSNKYVWIPLYLFFVFLIIRKYKTQSWIILLATILLLAFSDLTSVHLFKNVFMRYRPSHNLELQGLVHLIDGYKGGLYGFVSSHAANSFGFATFMALLFKNRWGGILLLLWAVLVSYSRIYIGVHYPADIVGGALLGILGATLFYSVVIKYFNIKTIHR